MSAQTYASENDPYFLSTRGVDSISFNKQDSPPLAYLDKGIMYELDDGVLYFNGVPISGGGGSGDVSSNSKPCRDLSIPVFDGTTGEEIKQTVLAVSEPGAGICEMSQWVEGDLFAYRLIYSGYDEAVTTLGLFAGNSNIATNGTLNTTILGTGAARSNVPFNGCVFVGNSAGRIAIGTNDLTIMGHLAGFENKASAITAIGKNALYGSGIAYSTAVGVDSQKESIDTTGTIPNTTLGAYSMRALQKGSGNNAVGWRALEGSSAAMVNGPRLNNSMGNYNGLSATDGFENNVMIGNSVLSSNPTAKGTVSVGNSSGESSLGGDYNIYLGNGAGFAGTESRVIRIGANGDNTVYPYAIGKPTDCYIQGIHNRSANNTIERKLVCVDADGKLYGQDIGQANPTCNGYFQDYVTLYVVPIVSTNVAVPVAPTFTFNTFGSGYFSNSSPGIITYNGTDLINAKVTVQISARLTGGSNENFDLMLYRSGVIVPGTTMRRRVSNATEYGCCTLSSIVPNLSTGTTIQVWCANVTGTQVLAIGNINITVEGIY